MKTHISKSIFATLCFALVAVAGYMSYQQNQENMLAQEQELVLLEENLEALTIGEYSIWRGHYEQTHPCVAVIPNPDYRSIFDRQYIERPGHFTVCEISIYPENICLEHLNCLPNS